MKEHQLTILLGSCILRWNLYVDPYPLILTCIGLYVNKTAKQTQKVVLPIVLRKTMIVNLQVRKNTNTSRRLINV